jgi:hypothetical protein
MLLHRYRSCRRLQHHQDRLLPDGLGWKLNPTKCIFGVLSGKLLGFIISNWGIEANPVKITAITDMEAPATIKDVQKLTGCMAALNRFIS